MYYETEQIKSALYLLENLTVIGTENMKRIIMIQQILSSGKENNGNSQTKHTDNEEE